MKLDGKQIAANILSDLRKRVDKLKGSGITPTMAVILVGNNEESIIYVNQKEKRAKEIGAGAEIIKFDESITFEVNFCSSPNYKTSLGS